ncbi:hypothetical protein MKD41_07005 [Lutibacter sp. A64]|uniref:hypothetical protein n=1 Tax=Lutibacter sp. A64 TaxID=2918526 RepID=UPI001F069420|nr:hypothetical protein [Lutibacter sp. A64]UMB55212.1 hypothetical protein MKD41_07005 [Lutibacter sp. A64]
MKIFSVLLFILLNCSFSITAQIPDFIDYGIANGKTQLISNSLFSDANSQNNKFYLFEKWENNATIVFNGSEFLIKNLNLDTLQGEFVSQITKDSLFTFYNLDKVLISGRSFVNIDNKFYENLNNGNSDYMFLKEHFIKETKPEVHVITNKVIKPGQKKLIYNYFFYLKDDLIQVELKKKDILKIFKSKQNEIVSFVKKNKLSYKKEEDVSKIFNYYYQL